MIDTADEVIDLLRVRARRLELKARPIGLEVRVSGLHFALYGPDRGRYLHPRGTDLRVRWLTYDEANDALDRHLLRPV